MADDDGVTLRKRLIQVYNASGIYDSRLDLPPIPFALEQLWGWFWDIRNAVGGSGFGANPISFSEIKAFSELTEIYFTPWEISIIKKLDLEYIRFTNDQTKKKSKEIQSKARR